MHRNTHQFPLHRRLLRKMVSTILVLFLFISYAQATSSTSDLQTISISESMALNHSNVQMHEKSLVEERKNEISDAIRRAHGTGHGGGGGGSINHRPNPTKKNSATSLLQAPNFWASNIVFSLASFTFIFVCFFN